MKERRSVCAPNTAFTCNLIEIGEILSGQISNLNMIFRCAYHLPHDANTPVLKLCRSSDSRRAVTPATSILDPKGVFLLRVLREPSTLNSETSSEAQQEHFLFLWCGSETSPATADFAERLARNMFGILTRASTVTRLTQGQESKEFLDFLVDDGPFSVEKTLASSQYKDFYDFRPAVSTVPDDLPVSARSFEHSVELDVHSNKRKVSLSLDMQGIRRSNEANEKTEGAQLCSVRPSHEEVSATAAHGAATVLQSVTAPSTLGGSDSKSPAPTVETALSAVSALSTAATGSRNSPRTTSMNILVVSSNRSSMMGSLPLALLQTNALETNQNQSASSTRGEAADTEIDVTISTGRVDAPDEASPTGGRKTDEERPTQRLESTSSPTNYRTLSSSASNDFERPPLSKGGGASRLSLLSNRSREALLSPSHSHSTSPNTSSLPSSTEADSTEPTHLLIPSGSKTRISLLSLAGVGIAQRPPSQEKRGIFVSPRVAPQPLSIDKSSEPFPLDATADSLQRPISASEKFQLSGSTRTTCTNVTGDTPRIASPPTPSSALSEHTNHIESQHLALNVGIAELSGALLSSGRIPSASLEASLQHSATPTLSRTASKEQSPFALPIKGIGGKITPNSDRLPEHIGLSRGYVL